MFERVFIYSNFFDWLLCWPLQWHQDPVSNFTFANQGADGVRLGGCVAPDRVQPCPTPQRVSPPSGLPKGLFFYRHPAPYYTLASHLWKSDGTESHQPLTLRCESKWPPHFSCERTFPVVHFPLQQGQAWGKEPLIRGEKTFFYWHSFTFFIFHIICSFSKHLIDNSY